MPTKKPYFESLILRLKEYDVDYVVIGGLASKAKLISFYDMALWIASAKDMIAMKSAAGRAKDIALLSELKLREQDSD